MIEIATAFLGLISATIFVAHALDGFHSRTWSQGAPPSTFYQKADSEIFNKFGPTSGAAGVPCVIMTSSPTDS